MATTGVLGALLLAGCSGGTGQSAPASTIPTVPTEAPAAPSAAPTSTPTATSSAAPEKGTPGGRGANGGTGGGGSGATGVSGSSDGGTSSQSPTGCTPDGTGVPAGAVSNRTIDVDGDGKPDTEWIQRHADGKVLLGVTTASGATFGAYFTSPSPVGRSMLIADATGHGQIVALASDGRQVALFTINHCRMTPLENAQGKQYTFDRGFTGHGTGVGCSQVAGTSGRELTGLKLNLDRDGNPLSVDRTAVEIHGATATNGPSDTITVAGRSTSDPAVRTATEITCGNRTLQANGVAEKH